MVRSTPIGPVTDPPLTLPRYGSACSPLMGVQLRLHREGHLLPLSFEEGCAEGADGALPEAYVLVLVAARAMVYGSDLGGWVAPGLLQRWRQSC